MPPLITIVGRPNVGKSTLFNRLIKNRRAIVDDMPGVTRDRLYGETEHYGKVMRVADTGGLELEDVENIITGIRSQAITALNEADLALFVVDVRGGISPIDEEIASYLRRYDKPILLVLNKVDNKKQTSLADEFAKLGFDNSVMISAEHGIGFEELLEGIFHMLPEDEELWGEKEESMKVSIIGRPNVGKSSILNAILGDNRVVVSDKAGTTRDVIDVTIELKGHKFTFLDTAGIRKKAAITARLEAVSSIKARQTIAKADCCILVVNAVDGVTSQDKALAGMIDRDSKGILVALNKWDLVVDGFESGEAGDAFIKDLRQDLKFLKYAPVVSTCALSGMRVPKLSDKLVQIAESQKRVIDTAALHNFRDYIQSRYPVPSFKGKQTEIFKIQHYSTAPAGFRIFVRGFVPPNYLKFYERELREMFDLEGLPINFAIVRV